MLHQSYQAKAPTKEENMIKKNAQNNERKKTLPKKNPPKKM
jgi:hypothetical protein